MLTNNTLNEHLQSIDDEANQLYDKLIDNYKKNRDITEELKEKDQLEWTQEMNNIENCIMEVIYSLWFIKQFYKTENAC